MKHSLTIALNDLRVYFSDRSNLFSLVGLPIVLTLMLGVAFQGSIGGSSRSIVDIVDQDQTSQSAQLVTDLRAADTTLILCPADNDTTDCELPADGLTEAAARARVTSLESSALIIIPPGFGAALETTQPVQLTYASLASLATGDRVLVTLNTVVERYNVTLAAQVVGLQSLDTLPRSADFFDAAARADFAAGVNQQANAFRQAHPTLVSLSLSNSTKALSGVQQGFGQSIPGMGSMFVMFTLFTGIAVLIRERRQWTLQRMVMMPLTRTQILGGKVLFLFCLGMIQYVVVFAVAVFTGTSLGNNPVGLVATMIAFVFCITALTLFLSTRIHTEAQANGIALLMAMTLAPLGGAWWALEIVPAFMRTVGHLSPVAWAMDSYRALIFEGGTLLTILPALLILLAAGVVLFGLGVRGFRYE